MGAKDLRRIFGNDDPRGGKYHFAQGGASPLAGETGFLQSFPDAGTHTNRFHLRFFAQNVNYSGFTDGDLCDEAGTPQQFDPRTTELWFQHKNPRVNDQWETIGGWVKGPTGWSQRNGQITLANGSTLVTKLGDLAPALSVGGTTTFAYQSGPLQNTPISPFIAGRARWLRISPSGPQTGWSPVRTFFGDQEIWVCNGLSRFLAACAYQPLLESKGGPPAFGGIFPYSSPTEPPFDVTRPSIQLQGHDGVTPTLNSLAHPTILEGFRCGVPIPNSVGLFPTTEPYNDLASGVRIDHNALMSDGNYQPAEVSAALPEAFALKSLSDDITAEPEALVREIIASHLDYRALLTADWTNTRGPAELAYRTQFYYVPLRPTGFDGPPPLVSRHVVSTDFAKLSNWWLTDPALLNTLTGYTIFTFVQADLRTSRPMSGVLTQAAFLAPAGYKVRSVAARILRTFTCADISGFQPDAQQFELHQRFIPTSEPTAASHINPGSGCVACHINMDPLASAISSGYLETAVVGSRTLERLAAGGELAYYSRGDFLAHMIYGLRGVDKPSEGALMGHRVQGIKEVGQVLANSRAFARCAVRHAFEGAFGRLPVGTAETKLIDTSTDRFMTDRFGVTHAYDYDAMVRDLVLSPEFGVTP